MNNNIEHLKRNTHACKYIQRWFASVKLNGLNAGLFKGNSARAMGHFPLLLPVFSSLASKHLS